jgi:hypothetical protein
VKAYAGMIGARESVNDNDNVVQAKMAYDATKG